MSEQQPKGQRSNNNRNQNNNKNRNNNHNRSNNNRNRNNNNNNNRKPRQNKPKPLVLSIWQKILIFLNLTSEDKIRKQLQANRPARNQSKNNTTDTNNKTNNTKPARSNTRVAKERKAPQKVAVETPRLYVGNLSYDATEYDIEDLFKGIGSVKKVEIIYNRHTHKSKGYGFVQMLNVDEAKRAVEVLHDQPFLGRNLIVNGSKARKASDPNSSEYVADKETSEEPAT